MGTFGSIEECGKVAISKRGRMFHNYYNFRIIFAYRLFASFVAVYNGGESLAP
jgi:hypothetical protein